MHTLLFPLQDQEEELTDDQETSHLEEGGTAAAANPEEGTDTSQAPKTADGKQVQNNQVTKTLHINIGSIKVVLSFTIN